MVAQQCSTSKQVSKPPPLSLQRRRGESQGRRGSHLLRKIIAAPGLRGKISLLSCVQLVSHLRQYIAQVRAALSLLAREQPVCNKFLPPSVIAAGSRCNFSEGRREFRGPDGSVVKCHPCSPIHRDKPETKWLVSPEKVWGLSALSGVE